MIFETRLSNLAKNRQMKFLVVFVFILSTFNVIAEEKDTTNRIIFFAPNYELQFPFGDMKRDFGINSSVGLELSMLTANNVFFSLHAAQLFGNNVKDTTILDHLMDESLNIFDQNGQIADILLLERGFNLQFKAGYLWAVKYQSSGVLTYATLGYHQHRIKIDVKNENVPQLTDNYKKMYDQMAGGVMTSFFLGYLNVSRSNGIHFYGGLEYSRSFSNNQRSYNFLTNGPINSTRNDSFLGIKVGWIIPISKRSTREFYYF